MLGNSDIHCLYHCCQKCLGVRARTFDVLSLGKGLGWGLSCYKRQDNCVWVDLIPV